MKILEVEKVSKRFGSHQVICDLDFSVPEHAVFGFIGKNGAGKTTTMKMILGLQKPDTGQIRVCQKPVQFGQTDTNRYIGYLPDVPEFYSFLNAGEYLQLCGEITGMKAPAIKKKAAELLELVGLKGAAKKRIGGYSRGMKQRLGVAQALLSEPKLLICDEPTSALDPVGRIEILDILKKVREKTTVIFSTHILTDVERICDHIAMLDGGRIVMEGPLNKLREQHGTPTLRMEFGTEQDCSKFIRCSATQLSDSRIERDGQSVRCQSATLDHLHQAVLEILSTQRIHPVVMEAEEPSLEKLFMEVVK